MPSQLPPFRPPLPNQIQPPSSPSPYQKAPPRSVRRPLTQAEKDVVDRHKLCYPTGNTLMEIPLTAAPDVILKQACSAKELRFFRVKAGERYIISDLNARSSTLWPLSGSSLTQAWEKAFLIAQNEASDPSWIFSPKINKQARTSLIQERFRIVDIVCRALRCAADLMGLRRDGIGIRRALELVRCISAGAWEGQGGGELIQVPGIGPKKVESLKGVGVTTVRQLAELEFYHIERLLRRNPPFGHDLATKLAGFPRLSMRARFERWATKDDLVEISKVNGARSQMPTAAAGHSNAGGGNRPPRNTAIFRARIKCLNRDTPCWKTKIPWVCFAAERGVQLAAQSPAADADCDTNRSHGTDNRHANAGRDSTHGTGELLFFWRGSTKRLIGRGVDLAFVADVEAGESVMVWTSCEEVVGTLLEMMVQVDVN